MICLQRIQAFCWPASSVNSIPVVSSLGLSTDLEQRLWPKTKVFIWVQSEGSKVCDQKSKYSFQFKVKVKEEGVKFLPVGDSQHCPPILALQTSNFIWQRFLCNLMIIDFDLDCNTIIVQIATKTIMMTVLANVITQLMMRIMCLPFWYWRWWRQLWWWRQWWPW